MFPSDYPNTSNIIVKPLEFNNIIDEIDFEVCSETKEDTQKRMLSDEDEYFFDSCSKKKKRLHLSGTQHICCRFK